MATCKAPKIFKKFRHHPTFKKSFFGQIVSVAQITDNFQRKNKHNKKGQARITPTNSMLDYLLSLALVIHLRFLYAINWNLKPYYSFWLKWITSLWYHHIWSHLVILNLVCISGFLNPHSDPYSRSISNHGLMDQIAGEQKLFLSVLLRDIIHCFVFAFLILTFCP